MRFRSVSLIFVVVIAMTVSLAACGGGSSNTTAATQALQKQADLYAIDGIEKTWHKASSTHDVGLMMSIWAPDSTFTIGPTTLTGRAQIRDFFAQKAAPFQSANHWVSDTPAYKIRITVNGDRGTLYFECHYIDVKTQKVMSVVAADQNVQKINGKWLITNASGASPTLSP